MDHRKAARDFLKVAHLFRLGAIPTEQPHPRTGALSAWALGDLNRAIATLQEIDVDALRALERRAAAIDLLAGSIRQALDEGGRIFLCGCGATGRLSLTLESLWRSRNGAGDERVIAFMAGGDVALVHALERFEDKTPWGGRHLIELGFGPNDLLIACTEGGETPFVLGAVERAAQVSSRPPWLLFCNPERVLLSVVDRFRQVHESSNVRTICLDVGPMALTGSTRMQASTVLQLAAGVALLHPDRPAREQIAGYREAFRRCDLAALAPFIEHESAVYAAGDLVTYRVRDYGITVFTDATERAPTFSLVPFDHLRRRQAKHSLCYISLDDAPTAEEAWRHLLHREPRPLGWTRIDPRTSDGYLRAFDFSTASRHRRKRLIPEAAHHEFHIAGSRRGIGLRFGPIAAELGADGLPELMRHTLLKQALNIHSTLVMGRIGRYEGNLMTWVRPTNGKLVDRSVRYVHHLLERAGDGAVSYETIVRQLFAELAVAAPDESVVLRTLRALAAPRSPRSKGASRPAPRDARSRSASRSDERPAPGID